MIQAIVVKGATSVRATVIANRTKSDELGIIKAMMIETLKTKLQNGIAHFTFIKKNGELRECWGTTQSNLAKAKTNGNGESRKELGEVFGGNLWLKYFNSSIKGVSKWHPFLFCWFSSNKQSNFSIL